MTWTSINHLAVIRGDALMAPLRGGSVQCVVTSPPYLGQRIYGDSELEVGRDATVEGFVTQMVELGSSLRELLVDDGVWWLNLGDKSNGSGGAGGDYGADGSKKGRPKFGKFHDPAYELVQFLDVPGKVAAGLQDDKWRLRQTIIWDKGQDSREDLNHVRRPRTSHEVILMLAPTASRTKFYGDRLPETGSVWHFPPANREGKQHQAPFPDELPRRCILASTDPDEMVLDPFVGSGTTVRVAKSLDRRAVGIDLYAGRNL